jgi:hypothetical protein
LKPTYETEEDRRILIQNYHRSHKNNTDSIVYIESDTETREKQKNDEKLEKIREFEKSLSDEKRKSIMESAKNELLNN